MSSEILEEVQDTSAKRTGEQKRYSELLQFRLRDWESGELDE